MVYTNEVDARAKAPGFAASREVAHGFVSRPRNANGRSALLPDAIISNILGQLAVTIRYEPLEMQGSGKRSNGGV
ncbi:hypothetical protein KIN20_022479 [Parelaphostrongylus tenuis]|uniref:Uncharacterized protein n=1 Tax=Parelaphostrongylus tenuis TaxID=148309 RepID=A0AAD5QWT0_PARTN|nr:hypothetical protein KIN20_022479 [Parelaphostrongylus tenuis]